MIPYAQFLKSVRYGTAGWTFVYSFPNSASDTSVWHSMDSLKRIGVL